MVRGKNKIELNKEDNIEDKGIMTDIYEAVVVLY